MIVLGGGPISCELAQTFRRLGVGVTIIQRSAQRLPREDRDVADFLESCLTNEGVRIIKNADVHSVAMTDAGKVAMELLDRQWNGPAERTFFADALLVAMGRTPNFRSLDLRTAGIEFSEKGVRVNEYLQTTQPHIYAAGDVIGPFLFTHMADAQARVVVRNILMPFQLLRQKIDYAVVPWCTYVDPEIATIWLNEAAAKKQNVSYDLIVQRIEEIDRAVVERQESGFVKVLVAKGTDKILGATLVCENAGDLLDEFVLAMKYGIGLGKISATTHAYPTLAELARKVGDKYNKTRLTPMARKNFRWLYRLNIR